MKNRKTTFNKLRSLPFYYQLTKAITESSRNYLNHQILLSDAKCRKNSGEHIFGGCFAGDLS